MKNAAATAQSLTACLSRLETGTLPHLPLEENE